MKKSTKVKILGAFACLFGVAILTGCAQNFCEDIDKAYIAYPYEQGVTVYCNKEDIPEDYQTTDTTTYPLSWQVFDGNDKLWAYIPVNTDGLFTAKKANYLTNTILASAKKNGVKIPTYAYWKRADELVLDHAIELSATVTLQKEDPDNLPTAEAIATKVSEIKASATAESINPFSVPDCVGNEGGVTENYQSILRNYGYWKFTGENDKLFGNWEAMNETIASEFDAKGYNGSALVPNQDFTTLYKNSISSRYNTARSCIATRSRDEGYGHYGESSNWSVPMKTIDWGGAWKKGLLEGLIVYPVAALVDVLSFQFDPALTGWGQIWALVITTLVVRLVVMALTFKGTLDQQKMQAMQPELAKLQAKYPNSKDNKAQAARLSQETMALYKRNKVSMFSPFLMMLIQFPVFMAIWTALSGNAALSSGEVLNLRLSDSLSSVLMNFSGTWYLNTTGWWTALVLFILMGGFQFCAMKLPQWITKAQTRKQVKLTANPTADDNANRMKMVSIVMFVFTLIMGFALPAAMGIYWAIGAIVSMLQTLITQLVIAKRVKKKRERRR